MWRLTGLLAVSGTALGALAVGTGPASAPPSPAPVTSVATTLTPQQAATKAAICAQFNSNVQLPAARLSGNQLAAGCPTVKV